MHSYEARVVSVKLKEERGIVKWLTTYENLSAVKVISVDGEYFTAAITQSGYDQMMKHFDPEWVSEAEKDSDRIKRLESLKENVRAAVERNNYLIASLESSAIFGAQNDK